MRKGLRKSGKSRKGGIRKVTVPNLSGLSRSQAKTLLESVGLSWYETASNVQNINLDNSIENQGVASGTTVKIGDSVSFSYYLYVAPPPVDPPSAPPSTPPSTPPADPPSTPPTNCDYIDAPTYCTNVDSQGYGTLFQQSWTAGCPTVNLGRSYCGVATPPTAPPNDPPTTPPNDPPTTPPNDPPNDPPSTPPSDPPAYPPVSSKSVSVSTLVRTPSGLVRAENLNVGDVLLSADIEGFPYTTSEGVTEAALSWTTDNPNLNIVNTTVVEIKRRTATKAVIINGDIFSQYHWILVKRNGITQFARSEEVIEGTDYVFDAEINLWEIVDLFEVIEVNHETISINCEPYDMFFTEKMLTHDSFSI